MKGDSGTTGGAGARDWTTVWHVLLILCVVAVSYSNALGGGFVTDDFGLLRDNPNIKDWGRLGRIFTTGYWDAEGWTGGLYRPLTILSFLVEHTLGGVNPLYYHIDNVVLHFLCSILAYLLLRELFEDAKAPLFAALLFAAQPVHVESVAWVSGRAELLWAVFGLASMLVFVRYPDRPVYKALSCALFAFSMFSKESAVVVPALLAVYVLVIDKTGEGRAIGRLIRRLWPYAAVTAVYVTVKLIVLGRLGPGPTEQALVLMPLYDRFLIMCRALYEYIRLGFIPTGLGNDYLFPPPASLLDPRVLTAIAAVGAAVFLAPRLYRRSRLTLFAVSWFFIGLLPVSNIVPTGIIMSDRAMYLPSLGICMLLGAALSSVSRNAGRRPATVSLGVLLLLPVLGSFMAGTLIRNPVWHDGNSLAVSYIARLKRNIGLYPDYPQLYRLLARMEYRFMPYGPDAEKAVVDAYRMIGQDDPEIHEMMSYVYSKKSMPGKALDEMLAAIDMVPDNAGYRYTAAQLLRSMKRYPEALAMAGEAVRLNPNEDDFHMLRGDILMEMGRDDEALKEYETVTAMNPENHDAYLMQGIILDSKRQFGPAIERIEKAVALMPGIPDLHYFLAVAYMDAGLADKARAELDRAIALRPDFRDALALREKLR